MRKFVIKTEAVKKSKVCPLGVVQLGVFPFAKDLLNVVVVAVVVVVVAAAVDALVFDFAFELVAFREWVF